jgi:hypothetical protein
MTSLRANMNTPSGLQIGHKKGLLSRKKTKGPRAGNLAAPKFKKHVPSRGKTKMPINLV